MSKLYVGGPFKQNNGSAITSSSTNTNTGASKMAGATTTRIKKSPLGQGDNLGTKVAVHKDIAIPFLGNVTATSLGLRFDSETPSSFSEASNHYVIVNGNSGLPNAKIKDIILLLDIINPTLYFAGEIISISGINYTVSILYSDAVLMTGIGTDVTSYLIPQECFARLQKGNTIMRGYTHNAHLMPVSKYQSGESKRNMNYCRKSVRTVRTATAIRAGYFDIETGDFTTAPSTSNDYGAEMTPAGGSVPDKEAQNNTTNKSRGGGFVMKTGQPTATIKNHTSNDT